MGGIIVCASNGRRSDDTLQPVQEGGVRDGNLFLLVLVGLPLAVAVCMGLSARSFVGGGRTWWLWVSAAALLGAVWFYLLSWSP
jgi:hypothetical protein